MVSAVIPTRHRPGSLLQAVESALAQTYAVTEVVVVIDGPDPATESMLQAVNHPRVRVVALAAPMGGSDARNAGVAAARGEWVAFLDDDDEWLPNKIERQLAMLPQTGDNGDPIVSCRFLARTAAGDRVWPERLPQPSEPLCEYLLARRGGSDGFVATPTILTRRSLLCRVPFRSGLRKHQDWDWMLRASREGARVFFCPEVLAKCEMRTRATTSRHADWRFSLGWIQENAQLVTRRAYAGFITTHVAWQAAAQRDWTAFLPLLDDAWRHGSLRPADVLRYLGFWMVPAATRRWLHRLAS